MRMYVEQHTQIHSCRIGPLVFVSVTHVILEKTTAQIVLQVNICQTRLTPPPSHALSIVE